MRPADLKYIDCICHCWRMDSLQAPVYPWATLTKEEGSALAVGGAAVTLSRVSAASCKESSGSALGGWLSAQTGLASRVSSVWCSENNEFIRWWHRTAVLSQHVNNYEAVGGEVTRVTMENAKAPPYPLWTRLPYCSPDTCTDASWRLHYSNWGNDECKEGHTGRVYWRCYKLQGSIGVVSDMT